MVASYNGWKASKSPAEIGITPFVVYGVSFPSGARGGDIGVVFRYLAEQFHARVEPLITPGCWGYYYKQSANSAALLSCHSSGTAIDFNAPKHPNGKRGTFSAAQVGQIRAILAELDGVVYWGGDAWGNGTPDEMHFEIKTGVTVAQVAAVANKIRSGGLTQEDDDMPSAQEVVNALLDTTIPRAGTATGNTNLRATLAWLDSNFNAVNTGIAAANAKADALRELVSQLATKPGQNIDMSAIDAAIDASIKRSIENIDVTVNVDKGQQ